MKRNNLCERKRVVNQASVSACTHRSSRASGVVAPFNSRIDVEVIERSLNSIGDGSRDSAAGGFNIEIAYVDVPRPLPLIVRKDQLTPQTSDLKAFIGRSHSDWPPIVGQFIIRSNMQAPDKLAQRGTVGYGSLQDLEF